MGFHEQEKIKEGIDSIKKGTWIKIKTINGPSFLAEFIKKGVDGLEANIIEEDYRTKEPRKYKSFIPYLPGMVLLEIPEDEINSIMENRPFYKKYLDKHVVIELNSGSDRYGFLSELNSNGITLSPYIDQNLANDNLEMRTGDYHISEGDIARIRPSSKEELEGFIEKCNKKLKEHENKE